MRGSSPPVSRPVRWLLGAFLLTTLALRLWYAGLEPNADRTYDERYSFENIGPLLDQHTLEPSQTFYLTLAWLPQAALLAASEGFHRLTGNELFAVRSAGGGWSATAYRIARALVAIYSVCGLLVVFLIGRRLFDERVGLLAAALLGAFTRDLVSAGKFKPDTLVVLLTLCAFYKTLDLSRDTGWKRFAIVGAIIGCGMSTKMTGISAALPITAAVLFLGWRRLELWLRLGFAALVSFLTFWVLNPYLGRVLRSVANLDEGYESRAEVADSGHLTVYYRQIEFLWTHHGVWIFAFAVAGLFGLAWLAVRPGAQAERRLGSFMLVFQVVVYSLMHGAGMSLFRGQNYLSVAPFTALAAAWAMLAAWRWAVARQPWLTRRAVAATLWVALAAWLVARPALAVYREAVPSNWDMAWAFLQDELRPLANRQVSYVADQRQERLLLEDRAMPAIVRAASAERAALLTLADAELLPAASPQLSSRRAAVEAAERTFTSRAFHSQGEDVVVRLHPWDLDPAVALLPVTREGDAFDAALPPDVAAGEVLAFEILLPRGERIRGGVTLGPATPLAVVTGGLRPKRSRYLTARFTLPAAGGHLRILANPQLSPAQVEVRLLRFAPPGGRPLSAVEVNRR